MDPITLGLGAVSMINAIRGPGKGPNVGAINRRYRNERPEGYVTGEDEAFAGRQRGRQLETIGVGAEQARAMALRRLTGRGITGAAAEQVTRDITGQELHARQAADSDVSDMLYRIRSGNQEFEREKMFKSWGAEIGDSGVQQGRRDLQQSTFMNSLLEFMPRLLELKNPKAGGSTPSVVGSTRRSPGIGLE